MRLVYLNQLNVGGELVVFDVNAITIKYAQYLDRWPGPTTDIALYIEKFIGEYDVFPRVGTPEQIQKTKLQTLPAIIGYSISQASMHNAASRR